ncbi:MAG TPA: hypothetical protein VNV16_11610 [Methylibium sp.]|nr:hypothetical protein [Methylibium sp.]
MPRTNVFRDAQLDYELGGQSNPVPASWWASLATAAARTGVTEQTSGGVSRQELTRALATWSGGTTGMRSNENAITFAAAASAEISAAYIVLWDASSGGNACRYYPIRDGAGNPITRTWSVGDAVIIDAGDLEITFG